MKEDQGVTPPQAALKIVEDERAAVAAGDAFAYLDALAEDAVFLPPGTRAKSGAELRTWLREFVRDFRVEWLSHTSVEVTTVENLAFHVFQYRWRVTPRSGGGSKVSSGKGLHILRCEEDGKWRILREIWNADPD
jgi:ketosteroid isomerase-like protein